MKAFIDFKSIKTRLMFWFIIMAISPLFLGVLFTYFQRVHSIKEEASQKITAIREFKVNVLNTWLDERTGNLQTIADDHEIKQIRRTILLPKELWDARDIETLAAGTRTMMRYYKNFSDYKEIFLINPATGVIEISTNSVSVGKNQSKEPYFLTPLKSRSLHIGDICYSKDDQKPFMALSTPIFSIEDHGKHIVGILVAIIDLENSLYPLLLNRSGLGETGETLIVNKDLVALNELKYFKNAPLKLKITAEPALHASQGKTGVAETIDYDNKEVLAAYTYIIRTGWGFIAKQNLDELYAPIRVMIISLFILFITAIVLSYFFSSLLAKSISAPLIEMKLVAENMQHGDFEARSRITTNDELGILSDSLNAMAESVKDRISIQQNVAAITETMVAAKELPVFRKQLLHKLVEVTESNLGAYHLLNKENSKFEHFTSIGINPKLLHPFDASNLEGEFGKVLETKKIVHTKDIFEDTVFTFKTFAGTMLPKEILTIPIVIDNEVLAIISLAKVNSYSEQSLEILDHVWININIAFSNLLVNRQTKRLAMELAEKNQNLMELTEELEVQAEELQSQTEELLQQNVELDTQKQKVEEANRLKSEFLSNMSHELRTPLNSVMALSRVLMMQAKEKLSDEETDYLDIIARNGKNLLNLINDILDLSKIEAGRMDVSLKTFSIASTIESIGESLEPLAKEKGIDMNINIQDNLGPIESDEARVHKILQNLIGNAIKFTEQGNVKLNAYSNAKKIFIEIADTGIGIPEEHLGHIFEEFRQVDGSSSRQYEGTGLGLAIAHKSSQLLGGDISVKSSVGEGSVFTLSLPFSWQGTAQSVELLYNETFQARDQFETIGTKTGGRILLVEDSESAIIQVKAVLEHVGYTVDVARGGMEALDYVKQTIPDGVILDLMMPEIDGFDVLEKIRSTKATAKIPVLILTAKDLTSEDLKRLSTNNIQQLIQKGDVDRDGLLFKTRLMLGAQPKSNPDVEFGASSSNSAAADYYEDNKMAKSSAASKLPYSTSDIQNILVIEDNPDNMVTIKAVFQNHYTILEATNGEEGLKKTIKEHPDLVLLDIGLPGMDGYEVIKKIKENKGTEHIPVIAITAHAMKGDREKVIKAGFDDYISKPIEPEKILNIIEEWMKR